MSSQIKIAISQFPVSANIDVNLHYMISHTKRASKSKACVIHFPELSLSGYETDIGKLDWARIEDSIEKLKTVAKDLKIAIIFGVHKQSKSPKPFNSTCVITGDGAISGYYLKSHLYGSEKEKFSCKESLFVCDINGVKCGFLICYDSNFPELFKNYKEKGIEVLFLSFYNANSSKPKNSMDELMRSQFITRATDNSLYISGSNSSTPYSRMPSSFACPDGTITQLKKHKPGILLANYPKKDLGWTIP